MDIRGLKSKIQPLREYHIVPEIIKDELQSQVSGQESTKGKGYMGAAGEDTGTGGGGP